MAKPLPWLSPGVLVGALVPGVLLLVRASLGQLGANTIAALLNQLGALTLILLMATLACTPLKILTGWTWPIRIRRLLGLLTFGYASAHFFTYAVLDLGLAFGQLGEDLAKRPFITMGFLAWLTMLPLAWTSTDASVKALGFKRWKVLHRLSYAAGVLGLLHFVWRVKKDVTEPAVYAVLLAGLLVMRVVDAGRKRARSVSS